MFLKLVAMTSAVLAMLPSSGEFCGFSVGQVQILVGSYLGDFA